MRDLTYKFIFLHPIHERFGTIKMQIATELIKRAIEKFNWQRAFLNASVSINFNSILLILFLMKQSYAMTKTHLGSITK